MSSNRDNDYEGKAGQGKALLALVKRQRGDEGLWLRPETEMELYLQTHLATLHVIFDGDAELAVECMRLILWLNGEGEDSLEGELPETHLKKLGLSRRESLRANA